MKLSKLKQLVREYDNRKGLRRRLFGDALTIRVLKELIREKEKKLDANSDVEITLQEYQDFAVGKGYAVDLSEHYLASETASAQVFRQWKLEQTIENIMLRMIPLQPIQIDLTTALNRINIDMLNFNVQPQQLMREYMARQVEQNSLYTRFNDFTLFQHSVTNSADAAWSYTYHAGNDEENEEDDSFDSSPRCAPAA